MESSDSARSTKRVRVLGEDLVLFRDRQGRFGLIAEHCPHRRASLAYGIPTDDGIRCPYHGWHFDAQGKCLEQPNESAKTCFKERVSTTAYAVEELGGMLFAYMGPEPRPLLPRYRRLRRLARDPHDRSAVVPANWLQIMENSVDQVHTEWLHGQFATSIRREQGKPAKFAISRRHVSIAFPRVRARHHQATPARQGSRRIATTGRSAIRWCSRTCWRSAMRRAMAHYAFQIRTPMDDTHTLHLWYTAYVPPKGTTVAPHLLDKVPVYEVPYLDKHGEYIAGQ